MNANELADGIESCTTDPLHKEAATMLRDQQIRIEQLLETQDYLFKERDQQQDEKKALYNLVAEQDKKIIELAFKLAYAERGNEVFKELSK